VGRLTLSKPELKARAAWFQSTRLKLKCDEPLLNVALNFNVRRYNQVFLGPKQYFVSSDVGSGQQQYYAFLVGSDG
jgi:hypothetical protein